MRLLPDRNFLNPDNRLSMNIKSWEHGLRKPFINKKTETVL
jgi:hypothetical protein